MRWIATCPHETVDVLAAELTALGIESQQKLHRGITFDTDLAKAYRAHLRLRTASRLQRVVAEFQRAEFSAKPFQEWEPPTPSGLLIANLPYRERHSDGAINALYRDIGAVDQAALLQLANRVARSKRRSNSPAVAQNA